ncbi:hypothetical protein LJC36_03620 [Desulfovibrio sp. OttesenSCG-928-C14]|nr:hypothetical protein [Desulfovibrio sp. OttesenSCG-928-C14]
MKSKTNRMWRRICECRDPESLPPHYWKILKKIALNMCTADFSNYKKEDILTPLIEAFLYESWKDLRELSKIENDLNFIVKCYLLSCRKYDGKFDKLAKSKLQEDRNELGIEFTEESLKAKFKRARESLNIEYKLKEPRENDKIYLDDIAYYFPDEYEGNPSLTEIYFTLKTKIEVTKFIKAKGLTRIKK